MKIAVMGAGAVGCYYGGMLARAGHEVTLIGRPQHVEAIRRDGLLLDTLGFKEHVRLDASTEPSAVRDADLVLFCVKSTDTESTADAMKPHLKADALVLTLQNGVDNAERLQVRLSQVVAPTVVYVATEMAGPGHLKHHGRGELVIAPTAASDDIAKTFAQAGIPTQVSDNVIGALWIKLILNCAYNALSAIAQLPYGRVVPGEGVEGVMRDVVQECVAVAQAGGVRLPGDAWQVVAGLVKTMPTQYSSTAQDVARGKRSEIDHLNGYVMRKGEALGVPTPVNRTLFALVKLIEARQAAAA
ncbi:ketopantoate reductase family protein [Variovorax sp. Sphag1AA]|uniref:ketopantoate reductase family protein n=1 Tax=Variovorax sp. Sphag1AA TaxID=2587027 RepID=UPI00161A9564|nr:2-dehydropantoate 2-reductase [Variovorax sp. Sphag1AA]MBB3177049.1 2-dehydropantoate 2-reductase [Variovorax sp. Sphag1AA]